MFVDKARSLSDLDKEKNFYNIDTYGSGVCYSAEPSSEILD
jgi:hypothetical protein